MEFLGRVQVLVRSSIVNTVPNRSAMHKLLLDAVFKNENACEGLIRFELEEKHESLVSVCQKESEKNLHITSMLLPHLEQSIALDDD